MKKNWQKRMALGLGALFLSSFGMALLGKIVVPFTGSMVAPLVAALALILSGFLIGCIDD